jgi:hypothetical protein
MEDASERTSNDLNEGPALRPAVAVRLLDGDRSSYRVTALVDSGSERTLAGAGVARSLAIDLEGCRETTLLIAGGSHRARFTTVRLQLFPDLTDQASPALVEWEAEVGFFENWTPPSWAVILGQRGFFDKFTVTMHRDVPAMAVDAYEVFDERYGTLYETRDDPQPRYQY